VLVKSAHAAMFSAKLAGRNGYAFAGLRPERQAQPA
jgi:hypothetical protein